MSQTPQEAETSLGFQAVKNSSNLNPVVFWLQRYQRYHIDKLVVLMLLILIGVVYSGLIDTEILGFTHDDGVYAITAKALAQGKGFTLLHVVSQPAQVKYPIVYPLILSTAWLIDPNFPENLPLLSYITLLFTLSGFLMVFLYLKNIKKVPTWLILSVILMVASNFYFAYFATSLMSEGPYLFFSFLTLWYAEKYAKTPSNTQLFILVLLSALTFHTRIIGITLIGAIGAWLIIHKKFKQAGIYLLASLAITGIPWFLWLKLNSPEHITAINFPIINPYSNYGLELFSNYESNYLTRLFETFGQFIFRLLEAMFNIIPNFFKVTSHWDKTWGQNPQILAAHLIIILVSSYALLGYFIFQIISNVQILVKTRNWQHYSLSGLYITFYLLICILWSYQDQMARFPLMILPLLWFYFFKPFIPAMQNKGLRLGLHSITVCLFITLALISAPKTISNLTYVRTHHWVEAGSHPTMWQDYVATFNFIRTKLPKEAPLAASNDVVWYLYTNHPSLYLSLDSIKPTRQGITAKVAAFNLMNSIDHYKVRYLVMEPHMTSRMVTAPENLIAKSVVLHYPKRFKLLYISPQSMLKVYKIVENIHQN